MILLKQPFLTLCVIPSIIAGILIGFYFSGIPALQYLVSPDIGGDNFSGSDSGIQDREFGSLEILQNIYLLVIVVVAAIGVSIHPDVWMRRLLWVGIAGAVLVLLEEIDYGRHFFEAALGHEVRPTEERNLHNKGGSLRIIKIVMDAGIILFFFFFPLVVTFNRPLRERLRWIAPSLWFGLAMILSKVHSEVAHFLDHRIEMAYHPLHHNVSEFRELTFYYVVMIYVFDIAILRPKQARRAASNSPDPSAIE